MNKNIKIDKDNKTINIVQPVKKGKDGVDGYTPIKDIDYLSAEKTEQIIDDKIEAVELKAVESAKNDLSLVEYNLTNSVDSLKLEADRVVKQIETEKILKDIAVNTLGSEIETTDKVVEEHINNSDIHFDDLEQKNKVIELIDKPVVVNNYSGGGGISEVRVNKLITDEINKIDLTETDPIFIASPAGAITANDITGWNNKISSFTEVDPVFTTHLSTNPNMYIDWTNASSNLLTTGIGTINTNSTTALKVERTGTNNNVFVVDTTNKAVGVNTVPVISPTVYNFAVAGTILVFPLTNTEDTMFVITNGTSAKPSLNHAYGIKATVYNYSNAGSSSRNCYGEQLTAFNYHIFSGTIMAETQKTYGLDNLASANAVHTTTGWTEENCGSQNTAARYGTWSTGTVGGIINSYGSRDIVNNLLSKGNLGTLNQNNYGSEISVTASATHTGAAVVNNKNYGLYVTVNDASTGHTTKTSYGLYFNTIIASLGTIWGVYNNTAANNQFGTTGSKSTFSLPTATTPTGILHLGSGSATAGSCPIKLTSGALNTTAEIGAVEYANPDLTFGVGSEGSDAFTNFTRTSWTLGTGFDTTNAADTKVNKNANGTGTATLNTVAATIGVMYKIVMTVDTFSGGSNCNFSFGGASGVAMTTTGTYTHFVTATTTAGFIISTGFSFNRFSINAISILPLTPLRTQIITTNGSNLTSGKVPVATTNGRLIDSSGVSGTFVSADVPAKTITVTNGLITSIV